MDDLKLFAKSEQQLKSLIQITHKFATDVRMQFGFQKCSSVVMKRVDYNCEYAIPVYAIQSPLLTGDRLSFRFWALCNIVQPYCSYVSHGSRMTAAASCTVIPCLLLVLVNGAGRLQILSY